MGNTVGSKFFFKTCDSKSQGLAKQVLKTAEDFYILGLWLADGYWRSSSIGLTSVNLKLIDKFAKFLIRVAPSHPIKKRIYPVKVGEKRKQIAVQVYINNRPLTRLFMSFKTGDLDVPKSYLMAYLAGRIDGDGHVDTKHRSGIRIAYLSKDDALRDQKMFGETNVSLYQYKAARTYVLYFKKSYRERISKEIKNFSVKLAP